VDKTMEQGRRTVLYDRHLRAGARMVDFAGWMMPLQYPDGIIAEHLATRRHAGLFDVSHMGRITFRGGDSLRFLQHVLTSDVSKLSVGLSQYTIISDENGVAVDDAWLYRFVADEYLLVVNAANKDKVVAHLRGFPGDSGDVEMSDASDRLAMISLQGPASEEILGTVVDGDDLPGRRRNRLAVVSVGGVEVFVGRTGYTGEPLCFELILPAEAAGRIWDALVEAGAKPAGLGARDTLRLEAGLPLYGHELGVDEQGREIPVFACPSSRFAVSFAAGKGDFVGRSALERQYAALERLEKGDLTGRAGLPRRIRQIAVTGPGVARRGAEVLFEGRPVGYVTSGTMVPYWKVAGTCESLRPTDESGVRAVAMGLLDSDVAVADEIEIDVRGRKVAARVVRRNLNSRTDTVCIPLIYGTE